MAMLHHLDAAALLAKNRQIREDHGHLILLIFHEGLFIKPLKIE
jgi:hypothetical protein